MYLTKKQIAEKIGVSVATINNYMKAGLPYYKIGTRIVRFKLDEVEKWIKER